MKQKGKTLKFAFPLSTLMPVFTGMGRFGDAVSAMGRSGGRNGVALLSQHCWTRYWFRKDRKRLKPLLAHIVATKWKECGQEIRPGHLHQPKTIKGAST